MGTTTGELPADVYDAMVARLEEAPVSLAVLFGSRATGRATGESDVDIAVEYEETTGNVTDVHLSLVSDLTRILDRDDVDVVRLSAVDPRVAVEALEEGRVLVGTPEDARAVRERLEPARQRQERAIERHIADAERGIERRLQRRDDG